MLFFIQRFQKKKEKKEKKKEKKTFPCMQEVNLSLDVILT